MLKLLLASVALSLSLCAACQIRENYEEDIVVAGEMLDRALPGAEAAIEKVHTAYPRNRTALLEALEKGDENTAWFAAYLLGRVADQKNEGALLAAAKVHDRDVDGISATNAIAALGKDGVDSLIEIASRSYHCTAKVAFRSLVKIAPPMQVNAAEKLLAGIRSGKVRGSLYHLKTIIEELRNQEVEELSQLAEELEKASTVLRK